MKRFVYFAIAAALLFQACAEEPMRQDSPVFRGRIESVTTRTALAKDGDHYNINWVEGDRVVISNGTENAVFKATTGGSTTTDFTKVSDGDFTGSHFTAWYPESIAEGQWPSVQTYAEGGVAEVPMMGETTTDDIPFRNLGGVIRINVTTGIKTAAVSRIEMKADRGLSGPFEVVSGEAVIQGEEGVALVCPQPVEIGANSVPFHISVPAQTYKEFTIRIVTSNAQEAVVTLKPGSLFRLGRSEICELNIEANSFQPYGGGKAILMAGPEYNELVKRMLSGKATSRVSDSDTKVKKVVFRTGDFGEGTIRVDSYLSEVPIYASFDSGTSSLVISTRASEIYTGENASFLFAYFKNLEKIENIQALNTSDTKYFNNMFCYADTTSRSLKELDLSHFNTEKAITFTSMFYHCGGLKSLDLSSFNTSNVEFMSYMFSNCKSMTSLNISSFDTRKVRSMEFMFYHCEALPEIDLKHFDTSVCESMDNMFSDCHKAKKIDVSSFRTTKVKNMRSMFNRCRVLESLDLSGFTNESLTNMPYMFQNCEALASPDFSNFNVSQVRSMSYAFRYCYKITELDLHHWDLRHVTTMAYTFQYCTALVKLDLSGDLCSTDSLATANHFLNASNEVKELRLGKNFNLQNISTMPNLFYQGKGYLKATEENPFKVYCTAAFAQKSLQGSEQARDHTNKKIMVWYSIYDANTPLVLSQEPGSITAEVTVTDPKQPVVIHATTE